MLYCFIVRNVTLTHICIKWVPCRDWRTIFGNQFYLKNTRIVKFQEFLIKNNFTWSTRTHKNLWILFLFSLSYLGPIIGTKITISYEFTPLQAEVYHMFSAWNLGFSHFLSKTDGWKYIVWDPWLPLLSCLYSDVSLKKHTNVPNQTVKL